LNTSDELAPLLLRFYSFKSFEEVQKIEKEWVKETRSLQRALAHELITTIHGGDDAAAAERITALLFGGKVEELTEKDLNFIAGALPSMTIDLDATPTLEDMAVSIKLVSSKGEARRLVTQNGLRSYELHGKYILLQKGKKEYGVVIKK
jgi:tyrosyl-tRNA synthetase